MPSCVNKWVLGVYTQAMDATTQDMLVAAEHQPKFGAQLLQVAEEAPQVFAYAVAVGYEQALRDVLTLLGEDERLKPLKVQFQEDIVAWASELR